MKPSKVIPKFWIFSLLAAASIGVIGAVTPPALPPDPLPDLVERIGPGVVNISTVTLVSAVPRGMEQFFQMWGIPAERRNSSLGSGFLIDNEGFVITNHHVVAEADEVRVTLSDKRQYRAKIIGKDPKLDLALLQIRDTDRKVPGNLTFVQMGDSDKVRIAQTVVAIGNPFGLQNTVTKGIISAKHRTIGIGPLDNFLQTDASINPGNSGGPLFNLAGEVIGVNSAIYSPTGQSSGLSFSIPINEVKQVLASLKRYGRVPRPWLGILGERMSRQLMDYYQLPRPDGVLVYNLVENGPADKAGIERGDILLKIGTAKLTEPTELERELLKKNPNEKVTVQVQRGKKVLDITLTLPELPPRIDTLPKGII